MGVIMQAFYWDCPNSQPNMSWWEYIQTKMPSLHQQGFTAVWLPPVSKAYPALSMGYSPYDYYDLGEHDQKGSVATWFGNKDQLFSLIQTIHDNNMEVNADMVLNHNSGADEQEQNPIDGNWRWTKFTPLSGKFYRDRECFNPSIFERWDNRTFGDMPDLCHRNPYVYAQMMELARWMLEDVGFDGFRYDFVLGYGGWLIRSIQEMLTMKKGGEVKHFGVGECWEKDRVIDEWLTEINAWSDNPVSAFDFPLRDRLKSLCCNYGFSLRTLTEPGTLLNDNPERAVTFVENHDIVRNDAIVTDKMLAYAFILSHEGYPCVFWQDYYDWGLGLEGEKSGIAQLVRVHEEYAAGSTSVLYVEDNLYIMQRNGYANQRGLIFVLNNLGTKWNGTWARTQWPNTKLIPVAWRGENDSNVPAEVITNQDGWGECWAPPRGYCVYVVG
ncbi:MAG: DUF1939 domain-containing protein [Bacteroidota bacterium]|nr:DUF1939 domain-containing protein [Bacteroidota bacterium]